jgi:predicted enzyme related to lactoylglutathione lyase
MTGSRSKPFFRLIDSVKVPVPSLSGGIDFYGKRLGHSLIWRTSEAAGLKLPDSDSELVIYTQNRGIEIDWLVDSVDAAVQRWRESGGTVVAGPFDIKIGRCAVLHDPWGNELVVLDGSKGVLETDSEGNVTGVKPRD